MPKLCLEELPPEVIGVLASFLPTNDLWALAKTSQSMLGATRSALGLRSLRPCHPMSTQDIERWNGLMTRRPIGLLRLPSSSIGVDLSDLFFLGLLGDIPPLRLPRGLRRLNIVYKSKKQHMDIFALHTIDLLMSTLSAQHARSLLRLHISLEGIDLAKLCLPSFSLLKSFSLSMCPKRSVLSEIIPLPDLTGLPSQTLTSLTLHQLDHTPLSQVLHLLPRFPFLKYLALRYYQRRGTADILEQLVHGKCTRLSTLDLMELSRPSSGAPPLAHRGFNDVDRPPPSEGYAERLSAAFLSLSALGVRLKDLRLEDIWSDQVPIYMLVNRLWASSLRVLHLTTAQDVPLFGLAQQYAHWPFLEEMTIQDVVMISYQPSLSAPPFDPPFPRLRRCTIKRVVRMNCMPINHTNLSSQPSRGDKKILLSALDLFPHLEKLDIGDVPWECYLFTMVPDSIISFRPPIHDPSIAEQVIDLARSIGPRLLVFPKGYKIGMEMFPSFPPTQKELGRIGKVKFGFF